MTWSNRLARAKDLWSERESDYYQQKVAEQKKELRDIAEEEDFWSKVRSNYFTSPNLRGAFREGLGRSRNWEGGSKESLREDLEQVGGNPQMILEVLSIHVRSLMRKGWTSEAAKKKVMRVHEELAEGGD